MQFSQGYNADKLRRCCLADRGKSPPWHLPAHVGDQQLTSATPKTSMVFGVADRRIQTAADYFHSVLAPNPNRMTTRELTLLDRLRQLPPARIAEVVDFVDFLVSREERAAAASRLTSGLRRLDAESLPPLSEEEIAAEIAAVRSTRRDGENPG